MDTVTGTELPMEVWHRVLKFLAPDELISVRTVCSSWTHYIFSDSPWAEYIRQYFGTRYENAPFLLDPQLTSRDRFWRSSRLHHCWVQGEQTMTILGGTMGHVKQIRLEGRNLALNLGERIKVFDMEKNQTVWQFHEDLPPGYSIPSFDLWRQLVILPGATDHSLLLGIDHTTGKRKLLIHTGQSISVVRQSRETNFIASGGRKIQVWDPEKTNAPVLTLQEQHRGVVNCLELEQNLVTACHKGKKIRVWDLRSGNRVLTLSGHKHLIHCVALNASHIASGSKDATLRLWDRRRPEDAISLNGHSRPVRALAMDDWKIVSGGRDHAVMVWDIHTATRLYKINEPESTHTIAFSETSLYVGGSSLVRHEYTPKKIGKPESKFDCSIS